MVSTGRIIAAYMEANNVTIFDLAESSGVEAKTVYRLLNDETKLSYKIAEGMHRLIPEISPEFLVSYDAKYQLQKEKLKTQYQIKNLTEIIDFYKLRKLYRSYCHDNIKLIDIASKIFGLENIKEKLLDSSMLSCYAFSKAKNSDNNASLLWLVAAYKECILSSESAGLLKFDLAKFNEEFSNIKQLTGTTNIKTTLFNMKSFCDLSGINFYFRPSIPNSRVKAVAVKDKDGHVFILISDLFRCIENLWISFVHECLHIFNQDFASVNLLDDSSIANYENYIDDEAMRFFVGDYFYSNKPMNPSEIVRFAKQKGIPIGIASEIYRYKTKTYNDTGVNVYIHYYRNDEIGWKPPY